MRCGRPARNPTPDIGPRYAASICAPVEHQQCFYRATQYMQMQYMLLQVCLSVSYTRGMHGASLRDTRTLLV